MKAALALALALRALPPLQIDVDPGGPSVAALREALETRLGDQDGRAAGSLRIVLRRGSTNWRLLLLDSAGQMALQRDFPPDSTDDFLVASTAVIAERYLRDLRRPRMVEATLELPPSPSRKVWTWLPGAGVFGEVGALPLSTRAGPLLSLLVEKDSGTFLGLRLRLMLSRPAPLLSNEPVFASKDLGRLHTSSAEALFVGGYRPPLPFEASLGAAAGPVVSWAWADGPDLHRAESTTALALAIGPTASAGFALGALRLNLLVTLLAPLPRRSFAVEGASPQVDESRWTLSIATELAYAL